MTAPTRIDGTVLTPGGWIAGSIAFTDRIVAIEGDPTDRPVAPILLPGCVDTHVHGGGGADMMAGEAAIRTACRLHARHGTTALLVTTVTAPEPELAAALTAARRVMDAPGEGEARVLGVHLEGPFINPDKLGAQPPFARPADPEELRRLAAIAPIRAVTFAPEADPDGRLQMALAEAGIAAQIGHSLCGYATARAALSAGCGVTHLFNAMTGLAHRGNGLAGAALAHAEYAEIVPDRIHVEPGAILAARRAIPRLYGVTDATAGAGMPDGPYPLGRHVAVKADGAMRLADGTLAGSCLTMDRALANLTALPMPLSEASDRLARYPADWIGAAPHGRLVQDGPADLLILDARGRLAGVYLGGVSVTG